MNTGSVINHKMASQINTDPPCLTFLRKESYACHGVLQTYTSPVVINSVNGYLFDHAFCVMHNSTTIRGLGKNEPTFLIDITSAYSTIDMVM